MRRIGAILLGIALVLGLGARVRQSVPDRDDPRRVAKEFGWYPGQPAYRWSPAQLAATGTAFALARRQDHRPCVLFNGAGQGGGGCFTRGWAVEVKPVPTRRGFAYVGLVASEAATVRFGDRMTVPVIAVPGLGRYVAVYDEGGALRKVRQNEIVALDAQGRLLGRQHYNDGHGGFGAMDGRFDRRWARRR